MRMMEIALGALVMAVAVALAFDAAAFFAPVPAAGLGPTLALFLAGATFAAHGQAGRSLKLKRVAAGKWRAVFYALLALSVAMFAPLLFELLDLLTVAGFPLGYYLAAQGLLLFFAILAFRAASHLDALDETVAPTPSAGDA